MNKQIFAAMTLVIVGIGSSHAGLFDTLAKVNQAVGAVRGNTAPVAQPNQYNQNQYNQNQLSPTNQQMMQSYASLDCASLNGLALVMQQQIQAAPQENQVSKTTGLLGKAGGLFASVGAMAGVDVNTLQQANQLAQQANSMSANSATANPQSTVELNQQLATLMMIKQAKACQ